MSEAFLGDHHRGRVGVARHQCRHDRTVDHAKPGDPVHAKARIRHRHADRIPSCRCRSDGRWWRRSRARIRGSRCPYAPPVAGLVFTLDVRLERRGRREPARVFDRLDCAEAILLGGEVVRPHRRRLHRIGRLDLDAAARFRPQLANREGASRPVDAACRRPDRRTGSRNETGCRG